MTGAVSQREKDRFANDWRAENAKCPEPTDECLCLKPFVQCAAGTCVLAPAETCPAAPPSTGTPCRDPTLRCPYATAVARCDGSSWHAWTLSTDSGRCPASPPSGAGCSDASLACSYPDACQAALGSPSPAVYVCEPPSWQAFDALPVVCPLERPVDGSDCGPCGLLYDVCKYDPACNSTADAHEARCVSGRWSVTPTPAATTCPP